MSKGTFVGSASHMVPTTLTRVSSGWVDQDLRTVRKMAVAGASAAEIGAALGWSYVRVTHYIKRNKIVWNQRHSGNPMGGGFEPPANWREKAVELRLSGMSVNKIAETVGVTFGVVGQYLREAGVPDPKLPRGKKSGPKQPKPISDRERQSRCAAAILRRGEA